MSAPIFKKPPWEDHEGERKKTHLSNQFPSTPLADLSPPTCTPSERHRSSPWKIEKVVHRICPSGVWRTVPRSASVSALDFLFFDYDSRSRVDWWERGVYRTEGKKGANKDYVRTHLGFCCLRWDPSLRGGFGRFLRSARWAVFLLGNCSNLGRRRLFRRRRGRCRGRRGLRFW